MLLRWLFAALHLVALGIGLGGVWARARALRGTLDEAGVRRVLYADNVYGIAALLWIGTGLVRVFAGLERGASYYLGNTVFWIKIALFALVFGLEILPMVTFVRWRIRRGRGEPVGTDARVAGVLATLSVLEGLLIVAMVFVAAALARGLGG